MKSEKKNVLVVDKFAAPTVMDGISAVFGGSNMRELMPKYDDIPQEFRRGNTKWNKFQSDWFYGGITKDGLIAKEGIDLNVAMRHLASIQSSFEPKHEHKEAGVAYLASRWLDDKSTWQIAKKPVPATR